MRCSTIAVELCHEEHHCVRRRPDSPGSPHPGRRIGHVGQRCGSICGVWPRGPMGSSRQRGRLETRTSKAGAGYCRRYSRISMRAAWVCVCRTTCLAKSCMIVTMCGRPPTPPVRLGDVRCASLTPTFAVCVHRLRGGQQAQSARELLTEPDHEVLQDTTTRPRPTRPGRLSREERIQADLKMPVQAVTLEVFRAAVSISRRFGLSYWDGAILAAARSLGCDAVYSEDLSSEQDYDGLRVINPFPEAPIAQ